MGLKGRPFPTQNGPEGGLRQEKFLTEQGRLELLAELVAIGEQLKRATDVTNGMRVALCRGLGGGERNDSYSEVLFSIEVDTQDHNE